MSTPLSETTFWILTALTTGRRHGYGIIQQIEAASGGPGPKVTTLYAALERLKRESLVEADGEETVNGRVRRYYRLTDTGAQSLGHEIARIEARARVARSSLSATRPGYSFRLAQEAGA